MKILIDENIPLITAQALREQGLDVVDIRGTPEQGMKDEILWQKAQTEKRLLITTDKGFSHYRQENHYGILIIRLRQPTRLKVHKSVMQALKRNPEREWPGLMVVMRDTVQSAWKFNNEK